MMSTFSFNPRYGAPSKEVIRRLELSRKAAERTQTRDLKCPVCGFRVQTIPVKQTDIVFIKCHKCKFTGALDPAYFRRMKRYSPKQQPKKLRYSR